MHPPWITFHFLFFLFAITTAVSREVENKDDNSTVSRPQREIYERERRLIPYMTYYITQSLANPTTGGSQNVFAPPTARENIFQVDGVPKIPLNTVQNVNSQQIEILPKPVIGVPNPSFLGPVFQAYKPKESGILPQIYRLESGVIRPRIHGQNQPQQIQSETQPLQIVKVSPSPTVGKYAAPQLVKIIPVITKLPFEDPSTKSYVPQPQIAYSRPNIQTLAQDARAINDRNYYKQPTHTENSYQDNKVFAGSIPKENLQLRLIRPTIPPETNKYAIAKIIVSTTTQSPYTEIKFNDDRTVGNVGPASIAPPPPEYSRETLISTVPSFAGEKYATPRQQVYYVPKAGGDHSQEQEFVQKTEPLPRLRVPQEEKIRFVATVTPVSVTNDLDGSPIRTQDEGQTDNVYEKQSLNNLFTLLKETNKLPQHLTPDNIDTGIKTLALILERLQLQRNFQREQTSGTTSETPKVAIKHHQNYKKVHSFPEKSGTSTPGRPGIDYPIYSSIPQTNFDCSTQRYKGFFGDPDTNCQVWHYCDLNGGQASFLCPNGTIFSQVALTCDWWFNVKCASTSQLYVLNERLYKYILPFSPSFPEDYSGPVVDTYLTAKFKEMESKSKLKALKSVSNSTTAKPEITTIAQTELPTESVEEYQTISTDG